MMENCVAALDKSRRVVELGSVVPSILILRSAEEKGLGVDNVDRQNRCCTVCGCHGLPHKK